MASSTNNKFYVPVDLGHTALLLADIQDQIATRFPQQKLDQYLGVILRLINVFRGEIAQQRSRGEHAVPLIIHHVFPAGINDNGFISPYNKIFKLLASLEASGHFTPENSESDPRSPSYCICAGLSPKQWGTKDEIIIPKLSASCFMSSELLGYLRARDVKHVVICGLTTAGAVLGSARQGADLDFHIIVPREGVMDDEEDVNDFILDRLLPKFVDVVGVGDVEGLFNMKREMQ